MNYRIAQWRERQRIEDWSYVSQHLAIRPAFMAPIEASIEVVNRNNTDCVWNV
jgi:hypothetical protein